MAIFPLFLEGDAFQLFSQLSAADQENETKVKASFETANVVTAAKAYRRFRVRTLRVDELVDSYVADLRRLLGLSGHLVSIADKDPVLLEQMIAGLPVDYARQIRILW
eukprot:scpid106869/ scgid11118/ 